MQITKNWFGGSTFWSQGSFLSTNKNKENLIKNKIIGLALILTLASGCSSLDKTVLMSASLGAGAGAVVGNQSGGSSKQTAISAAIGAVVSGIAGYFIHKGIEKRDEKVRRDTLFNLDRNDVSVPNGFGFSLAHGVSAPKIESQWVPTQVKGKKLVEGHKIWIITDDVQWVPNVSSGKKK